MCKTLRDWFGYEYEPTGATAECYAKVMDCLDRIDAGETSIDDRPAESALILAAVNFVNTLNDEMEDDKLSAYQARSFSNLVFMLLRHVSLLTYREILALFPVPIPYKDGIKYFDGKDIYYNEEHSQMSSPSLSSLCLICLCSCGIYFGEETMGTTDFDTVIGDNVIEFISGNGNPTLSQFHGMYLYAHYSLWYALDNEQLQRRIEDARKRREIAKS